MSNDQTNPTPQAAETKVLPRYPFPGFKALGVGETIQDGDMYFEQYSSGRLVPSTSVGSTVSDGMENSYFRPIEPTPQAPCDGAERLEDGGGFFVPAQAPEGTSPADERANHWAVKRPGLADQFRGEAIAAREALGLGDEKSDDISPNDITAAVRSLVSTIAAARAQVKALTDAVTKAQAELARWIVPGSGLSEKRLITNLLAILDDQELVKLVADSQALVGGGAA